MPDGDLHLWPLLAPLTADVLFTPVFPQYPLPQYVSLGQIAAFVGSFPAGDIAPATPASGATIVMAGYSLFVDGAATLAALTIRLPPVTGGNTATICFAMPVTALVVQDAAGAAVAGAPTSGFGPGAAIEFRYVATKWVYWK